jgi:4'-phosphopantetheinyl transferase
MITVYYSVIDHRLGIESLNAYLQQLPVQECRKVLLYKNWKDQQRSLFGRLLLKWQLIELGYSGSCLAEIQYTVHHRPFVKIPGLDFNVSHSGNYVVCVVSTENRVGIDIEEVVNINFYDLQYQFRTDEWVSIEASGDPLQTFYDYWTQKEAIVKLDGKGLHVPLKDIYINGEVALVHGQQVYLQCLRLDNAYSCHLAVNNRYSKVFTRKINWV